MRPLTLIAGTIAALTPFVNHLLITSAGLGLAGAAAGTVALHALQSALLVGLAVWQNRQCPRDAKPWTGFTREAFSQIPAYLAVAVPGTGMMVGGLCALCVGGRLCTRRAVAAWQSPARVHVCACARLLPNAVGRSALTELLRRPPALPI